MSVIVGKALTAGGGHRILHDWSLVTREVTMNGQTMA